MDHPWNTPLDLGGAASEHRFAWGPFALVLKANGGDLVVEVQSELNREPFRFLRRSGAPLTLTARPADRSIVARPAVPLEVLAGGHAVIHVSSPLWVGLAEGGAAPFFEVPTVPPKQTWLGATPQAGRPAFATRTRARVDLGNLELEPGRVLTQVKLVNRLREPWAVERIEVPAPHLALYQCQSHDGPTLWTSTVRVERTAEDEVDAQITAGPPPEAGSAQRVAEPRQLTTPRLSLAALGRWAWA